MPHPRTFVLTVQRCLPKFEITRKHLAERGIICEPFIGMDNSICRLNPVETFDIDRVGDRIGQKHVAACLTHYLAWKTCLYLDGDTFWILEDDAEFDFDWQPRYEMALRDLPEDWDILFLGSCCSGGRVEKQIGPNLFKCAPLCGHAIMYRKKALPVMLEVHQKIWAPLDIAMLYTSLPKLNVYSILPRIVGQRATPLPI